MKKIVHLLITTHIVTALTLLCAVPTSLLAASATLRIVVDATELSRDLLHATIELQVPPAANSGAAPALLFPKWVPGAHGPTGPVNNFSGLWVRNAAGKDIAWERDWSDVYRFFLPDSRPGETVTVATRYICNQPTVTSRGTDSYGTETIGVINWNTVTLYPEGVSSRDIQVNAALVLPSGWGAGSALSVKERRGDTLYFDAVTLEQFIDRPLICGEHYRKVDLTNGTDASYYLHLVADDAGDLPRNDSAYIPLQRLAREAEAVFGGAHFPEYHFLLTLSDEIGSHGLEHRESSLNGVKASELRDTDWDNKRVAYLLPHEFAHAWCGKYRRPAGMYKENFMDAKRTDLLWVYEGMAQYLGYLLSARCGYSDSLEFVDKLAGDITGLILMKGRDWRPLRDTEVSAYILRGGSHHWAYLRRSQDYYREGAVFFFEINALLRNLTDGQKSLDDFCRSFFAPLEPEAPARPFTRAEVVSELAALAPYNWDSLIEVRVYQTQERFESSVAEELGYRLEYTTETPERYRRWEKRYHGAYFYESLGLSLGSAGQITTIIPGGPADNAGLAQDNKVIGVEGKKYSAKRLEDAVRNTATAGAVKLLILNGETYENVEISYDGGLRYYTLTRRDDRPDRLMEILRPLAE